MSTAPTVSVLILNYNGREHLQTCLPTLQAQAYPQDRLSIEVIDNGSSDGSVALVRERFPRVVVHQFDRNLGFAAPYDEVARRSTADFLVFLNNDTRVDPQWLAELVAAAQRHQAHCVASRILDWDGSRIDFVGGLTSFIGHSWQRDYGELAAAHDYPERPLLFACGGSMLISREAYVDAGGFDRDFFAYFEDVDLGWRLSLLGYRTVLAPAAVTYHRLHGTAGRIAFAQRLRLYERNALSTLYKNYEDDSLRRVLPAAIALSLLRGLSHSGIDPASFAFGAPVPATVDVTARTVVHLLALEDFARQLPELARKRAAIQSRRQRSDRELAPLFGEPFRLHEGGRYEEIARTLIRDFEIDALFDDPPSAKATGGKASGGRRSTVPVSDDAPPPALEDAAGLGPDTPLVSIVILTLLGPTHLPDCLASLRAQTYPSACREVIVVDNASASDPRAAVETYYPGARVIRNTENIGFAAGNNVGARAARGHYVVFLNDDTRVHPEWLTEMVATARRRGAVSVASRVLNWDGTRLDFVGGAVNCEGKGFQLDYGQPAEGRHLEERPLLFANGAAMLVERAPFLATGGWDEGTFAYYEDVELGWRFWVLGHEVWSSPRSVVYHRHHGTSGRWPEPPRVRLYERNSLRMLYALLERETLERVLPAALMLACDRALLASQVSRAADADGADGSGARRSTIGELAAGAKGALRERGVSRERSMLDNARRLGVRGMFGAMRQVAREASPAAASRRAEYRIECGAAGAALDGRTESFPTGAAAALSGVHAFLDSLPELTVRRARIQASRRRTDAEILARFGTHWLSPGGAPRQREHEALHATLLDLLGVADRHGQWSASR
jgi:GT2 family glycosyltransferase